MVWWLSNVGRCALPNGCYIFGTGITIATARMCPNTLIESKVTQDGSTLYEKGGPEFSSITVHFTEPVRDIL